MSHFLSKLRNTSLATGKLKRYLLYAIGEVILVAFGILMALQVNNWNEHRKSIKEINKLLVQVHQELHANIERSNATIDYYRGKDSLLYKVLMKEADADDYRSGRQYLFLIANCPQYELTDVAYLNAIAMDGKYAPAQDSLMLELKNLYGPFKRYVDISYDMIFDQHLDFLKMLKSEKDWFHIFSRAEVSDEMIEYFLTDPFYLNQVSGFQHAGLRNHFAATLEFATQSRHIYARLSKYLSLDVDTAIIKNLANYQHYVGSYASDSLYTARIFGDGDQLRMTLRSKTDSTVLSTTSIFPNSRTYFTLGDVTFGKFTFDAKGDVSGFVQSKGAYRMEYRKVD